MTLLASAMLVLTAAEGASAGQDVGLVVHLRDYASVPADDLEYARRQVQRTYARHGIHITWADGRVRPEGRDGRLHVDVVVLDGEMTARHQAGPREFGRASHETRRAYLYHPRIHAHALATFGDPRRALAFVMAHELGHVLLRGSGHAGSGLMQPQVAGPIRSIPGLLPSQVAEAKQVIASAE